MSLKGNIVSRTTSEGIQDFSYANGDISKPFTIIKYSSNVGDKYTFTTSEGKTITREVVSHSTSDDYPWMYFGSNMNIKVYKVDEVQADDPIVNKITYISNHKFGLVGIIVTLKSNKVIKLALYY